ncbi:MAG: acetoin dehydrogenase dihydrolipoyllysine-residue acetyltransferase subunit [Alphaproteobacteria bacterium]
MTDATAIRKVTMPKWGLSMKEGTVTAWLAAEGATVAAGDEIVEIETEKVNNVVEAPVSGVLRRHVVGEGVTAPVGALIGIIAPAAVDDAAINAVVAEFAASFVPVTEDSAGDAPVIRQVNGRSINSLLTGQGDATPAVLVHGFAADLTTWMFTQPALAEARPVLSLDLPGHGASDKDVGAGDVAFFAGVLAATMDSAGISHAHLIGHSLGAAIALQLALDAPQRVASLTMIAPAGLGGSIDGGFLAALVAAERRRPAQEALARLVADPSLVSRDMVERFLRYKRLDGVAAALSTIAAQIAEGDRQRIDLGASLARSGIPLLLIEGAADAIIAAAPDDMLPAGTIRHRIAGAGHLVHMEKSTTLNSMIGKFLSLN